MNYQIKNWLRGLAMAAGVWFVAQPAHAAADFPVKPIRMVVPFPPGGSTDVVGRLLAEGLSRQLKQTVIVENRAGAGGAVGAQNVVRAEPDGYTLLFTVAGPVTLIPQINKDVNYDLSDLDPVAIVFRSPLLLAVPADSNYSDFAGLMREGKKENALAYGSSGVGSLSHVASEMLNSKAGTSFMHVPYKGTPMTMQAMLAGDVQWGLITGMDGKTYLEGGMFKPLAVFGDERSVLYPDVPTMKEMGVDGLGVDAWFGLFTPAGIPKEVQGKLNHATVEILRSAEFSSKIKELGGEVPSAENTPDLIHAQLEAERDEFGSVISSLNIEGG